VREGGFTSQFLSSDADRPPLRLGLLLDHRLDRATATLLEDLLAADYLVVAFVGVDARRPTRVRTSPRRLAWDVFVRLDERRVRLPDDPRGPVDREAALPTLATTAVGPVDADDGPRLPEVVVEQLRNARLDVILQLGMADVRVPADLAPYGAWRLRGSDGEPGDGTPAHAWELLEGDPVTTIRLERRADDAAPAVVLAAARFATDPSSLVRNRVQPSFGSNVLVLHKLWQLHRSGWSRVAAASERDDVEDSVRRRPVRRGVPSNRAVLRWLLPRAFAAVRRRLANRLLRRDEVEHWQMAIRVDGPGLEPDLPVDLTGFRWIESPRGRFYADPFLVERDGRTWLFFEDYPYAERRGVIARAEVRDDGQLGPVEVVLSTAGHLSYPAVVLDGDGAWMIPESAAESVVRLYRATDFPDRWVEHAELLGQPALDSTIWQEGGRCWLFTSLREPRGGATMLWLFHAESLSGPWTPHPLNPISTDVRTARGAGLIHRQGARLIRPSQDGSGGYGSSFGLNEITALSTSDYAERPILTVRPGWEPRMLATHTYNRVGRFEVIDAKFRRRRRDVE
jgi:hypothetical protein